MESVADQREALRAVPVPESGRGNGSTPTVTAAYLARLKVVVIELASLHRELALLLVAEQRSRVEAYFNSHQNSVSARDRESDYSSLDLNAEVTTIRGAIAAYQVEVDFLKLLVEVTKRDEL